MSDLSSSANSFSSKTKTSSLPVSSGGGSGKYKKPSVPRPRKAVLVINSFNPWSVFKVSFLLSIALGIIYIVAVVVVWLMFNIFGLFDVVQLFLGSSEDQSGSQSLSIFSFGQIISFTLVVAFINVILTTLIMMFLAMIYNVSSSLVGGIKVSLIDD